MSDLAAAVSGYADRFHRAAGDAQYVASPLGAWLVVALAAPAAQGELRDRLSGVLGCDVDEAAGRAAVLLRAPHPAVHLGAAVWHQPSVETPQLRRWLDGLPRELEAGPVPAQPDADAWAARETLGLIRRFPLDLAGAVLVLASALATKVSWECAFDTAPAADLLLPRSPGFAALDRVLREPGTALVQAIADTDVGPVAVHAAGPSEGGLAVVSVIADASVPASDVVRAAHPIAVAVASDRAVPGRRSLFDLPVGAGHSWTLREHNGPLRPGTSNEQFECRLPAWSAESEHALLGIPELGLGDAAAGLIALLPPGEWDADAKQVALARYTRTGFEAAAVTGMAMAVSFVASPEVTVRTAQIEFTHPYAVVAVARDSGRSRSPWAGLPVFSAWVARGDEPDEDC